MSVDLVVVVVVEMTGAQQNKSYSRKTCCNVLIFISRLGTSSTLAGEFATDLMPIMAGRHFKPL